MADAMSAFNMMMKLKGSQSKQEETEKQRNALMDSVDRLEQIHSNLSGSFGTGRLGGAVSKVQEWSGLGTAPEIQRFKTIRTMLFGPFVRQIMLEKGALNEGDIKRAQSAIPTLFNTPEEAKAAFEEIRNKIKYMPGEVLMPSSQPTTEMGE